MKFSAMENVENKKVRISKLDSITKIRNFVGIQHASQINVLLPFSWCAVKPYALMPDGSRINNVFFKTPADYKNGCLAEYVEDSRHALVNGRLYIFGGAERKTTRVT